MLNRLTAPQLDYLRSLAADASDHHAWNLITLAVSPLHMHWIPNAREEAAMRVCVTAFNAMAARIGMEWEDGNAFPVCYSADDGARYQQTSGVAWVKGQECRRFARGAYVRQDSPLVVYVDVLGRVLKMED